MNMAMWALAGGLLGWIGYSYLQINEARGMMVSVVIGVAGGFLGGKLLAPMFTDPLPVSGDFSTGALMVAAVAAAAFLFAGDQIHKRWDV